MTYTFEAKQEALEDARNAYFYYEGLQAGLGERFLAAVQERFDKLKINPTYYSFIEADREATMRDVKVDGFPYLIVYDIEETNVVVYAVRCTYQLPSTH